MQESKTFAKQTGPLIAASYNNLGVHAAMKEEFAEAAGYFQAAAKWNPTLPGVDSNWGRAAFANHQCEQAIIPLHRALAAIQQILSYARWWISVRALPRPCQNPRRFLQNKKPATCSAIFWVLSRSWAGSEVLPLELTFTMKARSLTLLTTCSE